MIKKRQLSNSRDPDYHSLPVTQEEEEAWLLLAAREAFEIKERDSMKSKATSHRRRDLPEGDAND
jgi:hypothetical protein